MQTFFSFLFFSFSYFLRVGGFHTYSISRRDFLCFLSGKKLEGMLMSLLFSGDDQPIIHKNSISFLSMHHCHSRESESHHHGNAFQLLLLLLKNVFKKPSFSWAILMGVDWWAIIIIEMALEINDRKQAAAKTAFDLLMSHAKKCLAWRSLYIALILIITFFVLNLNAYTAWKSTQENDQKLQKANNLCAIYLRKKSFIKLLK